MDGESKLTRIRTLSRRAADVGRRFGWGVGDQVFSSATNFALGVLVARAVSARDFGVFGLVFATYTFSLGAVRAAIGEPLSVRFSDTTEEEWRTASRWASGTALIIGLILAVGCLGIGFLQGDPLRGPLWTLAALLPVLLLQDSWRYIFFTRRIGQKALLNDVVWALVMVPAFLIITNLPEPSVSLFVAAWGGAAGVAAVFGCWQARIIPNPLRARAWWRRQKDLAPSFFGDFFIRNGTHQVAVWATAAVAGLTATGAIRGAHILLGPLGVLLLGVTPIATPEAVRLLNRRPRRLHRFLLAISVALAICGAGVGVLFQAMPDFIGETFLRRTWDVAQTVILPLALSMAATGAWTGAVVGLRVLEEGRRLFTTRLIVAPMIAAGYVGGAVVGGAIGAAIGAATGSWIAVFIWWRQFVAALRQRLEARESELKRTSDAEPELA